MNQSRFVTVLLLTLCCGVSEAAVESANSPTGRALSRALDRAQPEQMATLARDCLNRAEALLEDGQLADARRLFDTIMRSDAPKNLRLPATRGAILTRKEKGRGLLIEAIQSPDPDFMHLGLAVARELQGPRVTRSLAGLLRKLPPERQVLLIGVLADRGDTLALDAITNLAERETETVRIAAIQAMARLPDASLVPVLLRLLVDPDEAVVGAARSTLVDLPAEPFDRLLAARLSTAEPKARLMIIEVLALRHSSAVEDVLLELTAHADGATRVAALQALGRVATPTGWPTLVSCLVRAGTPEERSAAAFALTTACARFEDRSNCAGPMVTAFPAANAEAQIILLQLLGQIGSAEARECVQRYVVPGTPSRLRDAAERVLRAWEGPPASQPDAGRVEGGGSLPTASSSSQRE